MPSSVRTTFHTFLTIQVIYFCGWKLECLPTWPSSIHCARLLLPLFDSIQSCLSFFFWMGQKKERRMWTNLLPPLQRVLFSHGRTNNDFQLWLFLIIPHLCFIFLSRYKTIAGNRERNCSVYFIQWLNWQLQHSVSISSCIVMYVSIISCHPPNFIIPYVLSSYFSVNWWILCLHNEHSGLLGTENRCD